MRGAGSNGGLDHPLLRPAADDPLLGSPALALVEQVQAISSGAPNELRVLVLVLVLVLVTGPWGGAVLGGPAIVP
ncbi:hypothetical protein ABZ615_07620 [Streptomyces sp. NPDC007325]|uniref:hypothetical protein n=1 Tax=Streptomyces sp. NPDC007325 TaxID=3154588 RepID=UPI0033DA1D8A